MDLNAPLPWDPDSNTESAMWSDEDEAATWEAAAASLGG